MSSNIKITIFLFNIEMLCWNDYWFDTCFFLPSHILIFLLLLTLALLICAENSFWHKNFPFLDAFSDALQLYKSSGTRERVETRLNQLGSSLQDIKGKHSVLQYFQSKNQDVRQEEYKTALIDLILALCLGILDILLFIFLISYHWQPNPQSNNSHSYCVNI